MTIRDLAAAAGFRLPTHSDEKALRSMLEAVPATTQNERILGCSNMVRSHTGINLFWDEVVAFESGTRLETILERRFATWKDVTKPVIGRTKRSYSSQAKKCTKGIPAGDNQAKLAAAWARLHEKEAHAQTSRPPTPKSTPAVAQNTDDPMLNKIEAHLRLANTMKALEMTEKAREMGERFRNLL